MFGQPTLLKRLGEQLVAGEPSHAYFISGPSSIGKRTLALRIAQTLLCEDGGQPGGCGVCGACRKVEGGSHPDVREIDLLPERSRISIEQIREMERDIALRPIEGRWRVVIVEDAERLSDDAQDSILKTLEEPPWHAVLVITARSPHAIALTIVSRCQPLPLRPLPSRLIEEFVAERSGDRDLAREVAPLVAGRPGLALRLATDEDARRRRLAALDELFALLAMRLVDRFGWASRFADDRDAVSERFGLWLELLRDAALTGPAVARMHPNRAQRTARLGSLVGRTQLSALVGLLARLKDDLARYSNVRTALELLALRLPYLAELGATA